MNKKTIIIIIIIIIITAILTLSGIKLYNSMAIRYSIKSIKIVKFYGTPLQEEIGYLTKDEVGKLNILLKQVYYVDKFSCMEFNTQCLSLLSTDCLILNEKESLCYSPGDLKYNGKDVNMPNYVVSEIEKIVEKYIEDTDGE